MTVEMHQALTRRAAARGATVSGLLRALAGEYLEEQGESVNWVLTWGGRRRDDAVTPPDATPPDAPDA